MRDRPGYDRRRRRAPRRSNKTPQTLYVAIGLFVLTLLFTGALLLIGGNGDDDPDALAVNAPTSTATTEVAAAAPTATATATATIEPTATEASPTEAPPETPTVADIAEEPTETPEPAEDVVETDATEEVEDAEEPEATEEPVAVEEPVIGEFGRLPPPQVVSGGLSRSLSLEYELGVSLDAAPDTAPVYLLQWPEWTADEVAAAAATTGITGEVEDRGGGAFRVLGDVGELYVAPSAVQYVRTGDLPAGELVGDGALIETARAWLYETGLVGTQTGGGAIIGRDDELGRAVVLFKPAHPTPLLAFYPSATVTVGPAGTILEANIRWPEDYAGSDYGLRSGDELWNLVLSGQAAVEADLSGVEGSGPLSGTMTVTSISLAYSYAAGDGNEYLAPLVVFSGDAQLDEVDAVVPVSVYVSGVYGQAAPRG